MKNICFFNSAIAWGGGEKWHLEVSAHLYKKGYAILVIAHSNSVLLNKLKSMEIPCMGMEVSNLSFLNPLKINSLSKILKLHKIDVIVINLSRDLKFAGIAAKKANLKKIIYRRGSAIPIKDTFMNRYYFNNVVTDVLANSMATKKTVLQNNSQLFPDEKIKVIHNGMDIEGFLGKVRKPRFPDIKTDEIVLTNLGRLEFQKNQKFLVQLAQELKKRKIKFKLLIGGEGSLKKSLTDLIHRLKVSNEVNLVGFIEYPKSFLESGDIFLLPSLWEGFGYVLAEAALCKKPIVAFDVSSNPEVILDKKSGFLTPANDVHQFADAVEKLSKDADLRKKMGNFGCDFVKATFNMKDKLKETEQYLIH